MCKSIIFKPDDWLMNGLVSCKAILNCWGSCRGSLQISLLWIAWASSFSQRVHTRVQRYAKPQGAPELLPGWSSVLGLEPSSDPLSWVLTYLAPVLEHVFPRVISHEAWLQAAGWAFGSWLGLSLGSVRKREREVGRERLDVNFLVFVFTPIFSGFVCFRLWIIKETLDLPILQSF